MNTRSIPNTAKHFQHTCITNVKPHQIWDVWTDVSRWHQWDKGLKSASLEGLFQLGAEGTLVSLNGTTLKFVITEYKHHEFYTFTTSLPMANLHVRRFLIKEHGHTALTHEVWFDGLLGSVFAFILGKNFKKLLPSVMEEVCKIAETSIITSGFAEKP